MKHPFFPSFQPKSTIAAIVLVILYLVGTLGILFKVDDRLVLLTPLNLLISLGLVFWNHPANYPGLWKLFACCFIVGVGIEILGVQTGLIFGDYQYGSVLGPKIGGAPWMIGINWTMLVYSAGCTINALFGRQPIWLKALLSAAAMTLLDVLIEPVAMQLNFWNWAGDQVPIQNYIAWFFVALPLSFCFFKILKDVKNKVAILLFILQFAFFALLQ